MRTSIGVLLVAVGLFSSHVPLSRGGEGSSIHVPGQQDEVRAVTYTLPTTFIDDLEDFLKVRPGEDRRVHSLLKRAGVPFGGATVVDWDNRGHLHFRATSPQIMILESVFQKMGVRYKRQPYHPGRNDQIEK